MKNILIAGLASLALLAGGAVLFNASGETVAQAQADAKSVVDAAKARGEVAERIDGYLEAGNGASAAVRAAVDEINIGRKAVYTRLAREQNTRIEVVAQLTGEKQIAKTAPGQYIVGADGAWTRK